MPLQRITKKVELIYKKRGTNQQSLLLNTVCLSTVHTLDARMVLEMQWYGNKTVRTSCTVL